MREAVCPSLVFFSLVYWVSPHAPSAYRHFYDLLNDYYPRFIPRGDWNSLHLFLSNFLTVNLPKTFPVSLYSSPLLCF